MSLELFANLYADTLNGSINATQASLTVTNGVPAALQGAGGQWRLVCGQEIMLVTAVSGTTLTVTRGVEGTTAVAHYSGSQVAHVLTAAALFARSLDPGVCEARLSLSSTLAVPTSDIAGGSTLYLQPYKGNRIRLYDGTYWQNYMVNSGGTIPSLAISGTSGTVQDVFAKASNGTVILSLTPWTNATTRATALAQQDGVYVLSTDATQRYLGSIYLYSATAAYDTAAFRGVFNYYNRVKRPVFVVESTGQWSYGNINGAWRQADNDAANQISLLAGISEGIANFTVMSGFQDSVMGGAMKVAIGEDGLVNILTGGLFPQQNTLAANSPMAVSGFVVHLVPLGLHSYLWLETSLASSTMEFFGSNVHGISGNWEC